MKSLEINTLDFYEKFRNIHTIHFGWKLLEIFFRKKSLNFFKNKNKNKLWQKGMDEGDMACTCANDGEWISLTDRVASFSLLLAFKSFEHSNCLYMGYGLLINKIKRS